MGELGPTVVFYEEAGKKALCEFLTSFEVFIVVTQKL